MTMNRWWSMATAALLALPVIQARAQDQLRDRDRTQLRDPTSHTGTTTPDQDRTRDRLRDVLRTDGKLSAAEVASVDPALSEYAARGGHEERFRAFVHNSIGDGCKGVCLAEAVRSMTQVMNRGHGPEQAQRSVEQVLREQRQERERSKVALSDQQNQERLQQHVREHAQEMERERTQQRTREQAGDGAGAGQTAPGPKGGGR